MTVLVTGATGFVGRKVVGALLDAGHVVRCLVHSPGAERVLDLDKVDVHYGGVTDPAALGAAFYDVTSVIHLVAVIRERGRATFQGINVQGTENVLKLALAAGVKRFVFLSSIGAQDTAQLPFLRSKWLGERAVAQSGLPYTMLRPSLVFGEGDEFTNTLAAIIKAFPLVPVVGDGETQFQPIAVEDVARCVVLSLEKEELAGRTVEIGGPERLTYNELVDAIIENLEVGRIKLHLSMALMKPLVSVMQKALPRPPITREQLDMLPVPNYTKPGSVEETFGFRPKHFYGNIDYVRRVGRIDGLKIALGFMPQHVRDH
jgi:uncharacterized protein YbjT (DUF2867 family)